MDHGIIKLILAYCVGVGCSAGVVILVRAMPLAAYVKSLLAFVLPIPITAIALVMLCYGPHSIQEMNQIHGGSKALLIAFVLGVVLGPLSAMVHFLYDWLTKQKYHAEEEDENEE